MFEFAIEAFQIARLDIKFQKYLDLGPKNFGHHGNGHVIDGAGLISAQTVEFAKTNAEMKMIAVFS